MLKTRILLTIIAFTLLGFNSCKKEVFDTSEPVVVEEEEPTDECKDLYYNAGAKSIIEAKCATCHPNNGQRPEDYKDPLTVAGSGALIKQRIEAKTMPPSNAPQLTDDEISIIVKWIDCGTQLDPKTDTTAAPAKVSFKNEIKPIIDVNCAVSGCHVSTFSGFDFTTTADIKTNADNGKIKDQVVVKKTMPKGGSLKQSEIDLIEKWLDEGAEID